MTFKWEIYYLAHFISSKGIHPLPEKFHSIMTIPLIKTPKEARNMLGLTGYYCKFIPVYVDLQNYPFYMD